MSYYPPTFATIPWLNCYRSKKSKIGTYAQEEDPNNVVLYNGPIGDDKIEPTIIYLPVEGSSIINSYGVILDQEDTADGNIQGTEGQYEMVQCGGEKDELTTYIEIPVSLAQDWNLTHNFNDEGILIEQVDEEVHDNN